jgi:hypothetical protein
MLTRMISNPLFGNGGEPIVWVVGMDHPLSEIAKVVRMFVDRGGVEVYSVAKDETGTRGVRNLIPMTQIRLIEEAMPLDIFAEELAAAESDEDDEPDPDPVSAEPATSNGQAAS